MRIRSWLMMILGVVLLPMVVLAEEVVKTVGDLEQKGISGLPISETIAGIAVAIMGFFLKWLASRADRKAEADAATEKEVAKQRAMAQFYRDAEAAVDHVYITKIKPVMSNGKLDGAALRQAGFEFVVQLKDSQTASIVKEKGKEWVLATIHRIANRKTGKQK